ncbi:ABC-ATPase domain-containing protein [Desulfurococcaceae archaeon MEX13E-LK6-19]|nr:ABC-ATPase domain-containing protein [Desulfurococcaceae archaeon MEX13E-LK6-19]
MVTKVTIGELYDIISKINWRGYKAYKRLKGLIIDYGLATGYFTRIQGDPFAPPSWFEVVIPKSVHGFPSRWLHGRESIALSDYIARKLYAILKSHRRKCGTGNSCYLGVPKPSPRILKRSCVEIDDNGSLILRFHVGLPARGRKILGGEAIDLIIDKIELVLRSIVSLKNRLNEIKEHISIFIDQEYLRDWLKKNGYIAFVADDSILPRESSLSEKPMLNAVRFKTPESLRKTITLPSGRRISGMAIPEGVFLITGGGYHGKTTLLEAIQDGIYSHIKGDGREFVVTRKNTIIVKAEDGRIVHCVDITSFLDKLPGGRDTTCYSSLDASGSTSMASSISEAVEAGCEAILIDEDTSATNLLFKDHVMAKIIRLEPIKPLSVQAKSFYNKTKCSLVVIASASSAFIPAADKIIVMENFEPRDITMEAKKFFQETSIEAGYNPPRRRVFHGIKGVKKVKARGYKIKITYVNGEQFELDLNGYDRIVETGQVKMIAQIIEYFAKNNVKYSSRELIEYIDKTLEEKGFKAFTRPIPPDLTMVSGFDVYWVLNRIPRAVFKQ